jgi:two-component system, NtrC family, sensor kinase
MQLPAVRLTIRQKLVLLSLLILIVVSFGFALLQRAITRRVVEDDLRERAVAFAREIAATIGDERELASGLVLQRQIDQIIAVRQNVLQLDILAFAGPTTRIVATSHPSVRLPFTREDVAQVRTGAVVSRLVQDANVRYWEVVAPVTLEGAVAGAVASKFSLSRAEAMATRTHMWALSFTAVSVAVMALLMSLAVHLVVTRPVRRFVTAIRRVQAGNASAAVDVRTHDELGMLAQHFNAMLARIRHFNDELQSRVQEATAALEGRYREVERLNEVLFATQESLRHAERLAISGRLMAEVAHEVGTPIHSLAGHLELLRADLPEPALSE